MPFMDETMLDLFGEEAVSDDLQAALAPVIESRALIERVDKSHSLGCCQRLAWSKLGCIAQLSDGKIIFRAVVRNQETGLWSLSPEQPRPIVAPQGVTFVHIEFSSLGLDLVAFDQHGYPHVYTISFALDRMNPQPVNAAHLRDDMNVVVGIYWLPMYPGQFKSPVFTPHTKNGDTWQSTLMARDDNGVHHPFDSKAALLSVTRSNVLKILCQQDGQPWTEATFHLGELSDSDDAISHAAFGQNDEPESLIMATYDMSRCLRIYKVRVTWQVGAIDGNVQQPSIPMVNPRLHVTHLKLVEHCIPQALSSSAHDVSSYPGHVRPDNTQLVQLAIVPPTPAVAGPDSPPVQIIALFNHAVDHTDMMQQGQSNCSVISRWEISHGKPVLHNSFAGLTTSSEKQNAPQPYTTLKRNLDTVLSKVVLSITPLHHHPIIAFPASDGSVDFRGQYDMNLILSDSDQTTVVSLPQSGFAYLPTERCTDIALSPGASIAVLIRPDGSTHVHVMEYLQGWADAKLSDSFAQAAVVCLAREFAIMGSVHYANDEILALIPPDLDKGLRRLMISQVFRTLTRNVDYSMEDLTKQPQRLLRDTLLARIYSALVATSYRTTPRDRDIVGKLAWAALEFKSICTAIAQTVTVREPPVPEAMVTLRNPIKWGFDVMIMVLDDLFALSRIFKDRPLTRDSLQAQLEATNCCSLHLLFVSLSRGMFRFLLEMTKAYLVKINFTPSQTVEQRAQIAEIVHMSSSQPFKLGHFDSLLTEIDTGIRSAYTAAELQPGPRGVLEHNMLVHGELPECLMPVVNRLLLNTMPKLQDQVDMGKIYFTDTVWLGLKDRIGGPTDNRDAGAIKYDELRKTPLRQGMKLRRCRRCGSMMEDVAVDKGVRTPQWQLSGQKFCVCLGYWMLV